MFNGKEYGQVNTENRYVYSNNCGEMPATTATSSRMDVFVRGTDRTIWQRTYTNGWTGWRSTGPGVLSTAPAAVAWTDYNGNRRIDLFANGTELANGTAGTYWQTSYDGGTTWQPWQHLPGGTLTTQPASAVLNGSLYLFGRGTDGHLYSRKMSPTYDPRLGEYSYGWAPWQLRSGDVLASAPSAARYGSQVQVWYTRTDGRPIQVFWDDGAQAWVGPTQPTGSLGTITGAMGVIQRSNNFEVYGRGTDGRIYFKAYSPSGGWGNWNLQSSLGYAYSGVGPTVYAGNTHLFIRGDHGQTLWTHWVGGWASYVDLGGFAL